ncbi:MAG: DUF6702 family protein [Pseudomonadota bacterium]
MVASAVHGFGRLRTLLPLLLVLFAVDSPAHRGHAVWTDITWVGDRFEIVHRMHLADAIAVNRFMGGRDAIEAPRSLARVALYVEERFKLQGANEAADGDEIDESRLDTIGAEIEDDFMFVYQEWVTRLPLRFPALENTVLLDVEPDAQAFVRILGPELDEERERR